eukprot:9478409-Pyramimonas_sp.AAC.1
MVNAGWGQAGTHIFYYYIYYYYWLALSQVVRVEVDSQAYPNQYMIKQLSTADQCLDNTCVWADSARRFPTRRIFNLVDTLRRASNSDTQVAQISHQVRILRDVTYSTCPHSLRCEEGRHS